MEGCLHKERKIKKQTSYNYRNHYKLMNCWVNTTYFVKKHEEQIHWKYEFS